MTANTPKAGLSYPSLADPPNVPSHLQALAGQLDGIVIPKYGSFAAMSAANPSPTQGDMCFRSDLNAYMTYSGSTWVQAFSGVFSTYSPSWTGTSTDPSLGNGTITGRYTMVGKLVTGQIRLLTGSTTSFGSGAWKFSLPMPVYDSYSAHNIGYASGNRSAASALPSAFVYLADPAACIIGNQLDAGGTAWGPTYPTTWVSTMTNVFYIFFQYEAA